MIRKQGTIDLDLVETTPVVFGGRLLRFEWVRTATGNNARRNYFRFVDVATGEPGEPFADGHEFGSAFVHDGTVYVTGTYQRSMVHLYVSRDLKRWEVRSVVPSGKYGIFNTSLCRTATDFVMMFEITPGGGSGRRVYRAVHAVAGFENLDPDAAGVRVRQGPVLGAALPAVVGRVVL